MLETFTVATFDQRIGDSFRLDVGETQSIEVQLTTVTPLSTATTESRTRRPFSLVFVGPGEFVLPQHIYRLHHAAIGTFEIFLVPVGRDQAGTHYEAVFT